MIRLSFVLVCLSIFFVSCSQKTVNYTDNMHKDNISSIKLILPYSEKIYSFEKYARFMYQKDCKELNFRKNDLTKNKLKHDALNVLNITGKIEEDLASNHCN